MEGLTKQQIVLVALLISFVTSIATGIVTVALMDQAPPGVTQTINRVVERTIEKVVPNQSASVITKETVVVKEDDLVVSAIEKNTKSLVTITQVQTVGDSIVETFAGNGLIVSKEGMIVTDKSVVIPTLDESQTPVPQSFKATLPDGTVLQLNIAQSDASTGLILFKPILDEKAKKTVFVSASIADPSSLKLGQTIIALGGEKISVATGIVSNISHTGNTTASSTDATAISNSSIIKTDITVPSKALGGILVNLSGAVVGIRAVSAGYSDSLFLPSSLVSKALAGVK